jgi:N-acetylglucosamine kinase-like BadF-type ATPase
LDAASVRFEAACFGFSGGPQDKERLLADITHCERITITHEAAIALAGANAGAPGAIVIAGTGSIAFGRNGHRRAARAGGGGYIYGDEGSGFDIARQALRAILRWEEGWGRPSELKSILLEHTASRDANEALHKFYTSEWPRERVAKLAPLVDSAASQGDSVAVDILEQAGAQLAELGRAVLAQLFEPGKPARVSYVGGVFRSARVLESFRCHLQSASVGAPAYGPAAGALIMAYRDAGLTVDLSGVPEVEKH